MTTGQIACYKSGQLINSQHGSSEAIAAQVVLAQYVALLLATYFVTAYLFLRRSLTYLDPGAVAPDRIRLAYDALREGVLIVDASHRVVLANRAFRALHPEAAGLPTGQSLDNMRWLLNGMGDVAADYPWSRAMRNREPVRDVSFSVVQPGEAAVREVVVSCSPILDGKREVRGCLVTLIDRPMMSQ